MSMNLCKKSMVFVAVSAAAMVPVPLQAQDTMQGMDMPAMQQPPQQTTGGWQRLDIGPQIGERPVVRGLGLQPMAVDAMPGMPPMQGGRAPPDARRPDYSDGVDYGSMTGMDMADDKPLGMLQFDRLEYFNGRAASGVSLDAQAWYGTDENRLWLKAEGEHSGERLQDLRTEVLWDRPVAAYWDTQLGVRHDFGVGPDRTWAAFGVQGLAPYWFDVAATAYVGQSSRTALRFEAQYELPLTQRLILQPRIEANLYGRDDPQRDIGAGLSDAELGVRLRYEITRQFAPYVGVDFTRRFGKTADFVRAAGEPVYKPQLVAGAHIWF
ncbi:MAG TPA: copper resistance protein B [Steroidobacteraceae bacterium]|nr:copper resistance protein B [Steroidobacteraceae bacterium]